MLSVKYIIDSPPADIIAVSTIESLLIALLSWFYVEGGQ
jgi:hypothetical protein